MIRNGASALLLALALDADASGLDIRARLGSNIPAGEPFATDWKQGIAVGVDVQRSIASEHFRIGLGFEYSRAALDLSGFSSREVSFDRNGRASFLIVPNPDPFGFEDVNARLVDVVGSDFSGQGGSFGFASAIVSLRALASPNRRVSPYATIGAGATRSSVARLKLAGFKGSISFGEQSETSPTFFTGAGLDFKLSQRTSAFVELRYVGVFTDQISSAVSSVVPVIGVQLRP
jgi:hypothetical protein